MKKVKKMAAVCLYLLIISLFLHLELKDLLNLRQLVLVVAGGVILYLPGMEKKSVDYGLIARNTLYASYIETFILLFFMFHGAEGRMANVIPESTAWNMGLLMRDIALNFRPLFYGICIWTVLGGEDVGKENKNVQSDHSGRTWTEQESYDIFLNLGLTRREAEVAVHVVKGMSNKEIAAELHISETTVKKHMANIFEKLHVQKREEISKKLCYNSNQTKCCIEKEKK